MADDETDRIVLADWVEDVNSDALRFIPEIKVIQLSKNFQEFTFFAECTQLKHVIVPKECKVPAVYYTKKAILPEEEEL